MKKTPLMVVAVAALLVSGSAQAKEQNPGARTHDGFFLQMDLGLGGLGASADEEGVDVDISGGAGQFSIGLGGALTPNFILAGQLWGVTAGDPDVEINGTELRDIDGYVSLSGVGPQIVYYFMPLNLYLSATPSLTWLSFDDGDGPDEESDVGFGAKLAVGKEWWVSDNWALGLNGQFAFSTNESDRDADWGTIWFGAAFSATFN